MNTLYMVIPCYNEEKVIEETASRLKQKLNALTDEGKISEKSRIVFVNDGSRDRTWEIICELHKRDKLFSGINLSRNKGHQNAVLAGLMTVKGLCDMAITMDADLQDDIDTIDEMVEKYLNGADVVYGVRNSRKTDKFFKRFTAEAFYKFMKLMGVDLVFNHADFRLMSRRVLDALEGYKEVNLFLRGIVPNIGFKSENAYYERHERYAGESKYGLGKMISLAVDGITSFSVKPLGMISKVGMAMLAVSFLGFVTALIVSFFKRINLLMYGILCSVWGVGGIITVALGIMGTYVGKIYSETKQRPRYIIESFINEADPDDSSK